MYADWSLQRFIHKNFFAQIHYFIFVQNLIIILQILISLYFIKFQLHCIITHHYLLKFYHKESIYVWIPNIFLLFKFLIFFYF